MALEVLAQTAPAAASVEIPRLGHSSPPSEEAAVAEGRMPAGVVAAAVGVSARVAPAAAGQEPGANRRNLTFRTKTTSVAVVPSVASMQPGEMLSGAVLGAAAALPPRREPVAVLFGPVVREQAVVV